MPRSLLLLSICVVFLCVVFLAPFTAALPMCHSPSVENAPATPLIPPGYSLLQATFHQRHSDRWIYAHEYIDNVCWPQQLNSSFTSSPSMAFQCNFNRSSIWEDFSETPDPYAAPLPGVCAEKQITKQGIEHAVSLGKSYAAMFSPDALKAICASDSIGLECDEAEKNQVTLQSVYFGLCGSLPSPSVHPASSVVDHGIISSGRPFYLRTGVCASTVLSSLQASATAAFYDDSKNGDYLRSLRSVGATLARAVSKPIPERDQDLPTLLDNVEDCFLAHRCHDLQDMPSALSSGDLMDAVDELETESRLYAFDYFEGDDYVNFCANYFGYFFVTVRDRMKRIISGDATAKSIYIQVTSDSIISPQLKMLRQNELSRVRPPWNSQIIYQLLKDDATGELAVRFLFNGVDLKVCANSNGSQKKYCTFQEFDSFVRSLQPSQEDCAVFYDNWGDGGW